MTGYQSGSVIEPAGERRLALAQIRRMPRWLAASMAVSSLVFIAFSLHLPVALLADARFDDALFVQHGASLISGHWLGPYSNTTLVKGPGFPFFLALNSLLGLPVTLSLALLYSAACALIALTLFRILGTAWLSLACFLLMQWHPAMIPVRIIRDDVSAPQVLLILACVCHFVFLPSRLRLRLLWGAGSGMLLAWFWMTREDGVWILPGLALIILLQALRLWPSRREVMRLAVPVAAAGIAMFGTLAAVAAINFAAYGVFTIVDFKSQDFAQALDALQSVRVGQPVPYVPVPAKVRAALDRTIPAFASLEPFLNGAGRGWEQPGCAAFPSTCGDLAGGWFMWALRDAVAAQGGYATARSANLFYRRLSAQVHAACNSGRLQCRRTPLPFMPAMLPNQWRRLPATALRMYDLATWQREADDSSIVQHLNLRSSGNDAQLGEMAALLGNPLRVPSVAEHAAVTLSGWFYRPDNPWLQGRCDASLGGSISPILRSPSPDIAAFFHDPGAKLQRFAIALPSNSDCWLEATSAEGIQGHFALLNAGAGISPFAGGELAIDAIAPVFPLPAAQHSVAVLGVISRCYAWLVPPATLLSLLIYIGYLIAAALRGWRHRLDPPLIIVSGILVLLLARAAILVLVDISSFPGVTPLYWGAGFPLLMLALMLILAKPFLGRGQRDGTIVP